MFNKSIDYRNGNLHCDNVAITDVAEEFGTPTYVYSLPRILENYHCLHSAFQGIDAHIHYSAKANANLTVLKTLIDAGAGIDAVSAGEIFRAIKAGAKPENIVFAGVGKTVDELKYAIENNIGWINAENIEECYHINEIAQSLGKSSVKVALRLNPNVTANTHPYIATGHGGAKFGLTANSVSRLLSKQSELPYVDFAGIHIHIGSQLNDTVATCEAIQKAIDVITPYPKIKTLDIGGGLPVAYKPDESIPDINTFAEAIKPLIKDYTVILEPGRSIVADAGLLITKVLYIKQQAGQTFVIVDASMAELLRPSLYKAHHEIVPVKRSTAPPKAMNIAGPICETADMLGRDVQLPDLKDGDLLAIMTTGAYGMVMASNYNARPRPAEIVINKDGQSCSVARKRETWDSLIADELLG